MITVRPGVGITCHVQCCICAHAWHAEVASMHATWYINPAKHKAVKHATWYSIAYRVFAFPTACHHGAKATCNRNEQLN